jgi:Tfp pilus assembly protein PilX
MKPKLRQRGATLVTALVMLVVLTLLVLSAIRSSTTNLRIAGNMQAQEEITAVAQQATEQVLSNNFTASPASASISVPIGSTTYTAQVAQPVCQGSAALPNNSPNLPVQCISSSSLQNTGIFYVSGVPNTGTSWCYNQQWEVQATVTDNATGATATLHQGVSLYVPAGTTC